MEKSNGPGRPADIQMGVVRELRRRIVRDELGPGAQLPPHVALEAEFGVSALTVQRALDQLKRDGFVVARGKRGTFVVDAPPHLNRYALVFPENLDVPAQSRFWTALRSEAQKFTQAADTLYELPMYQGVDGHKDSADYARLLDDVRAHRVAGLIFAFAPHPLRETPLVREAGVARVAISEKVDYAIPAIWVDMENFFARALDRVRARLCRRVAFVCPLDKGAARAWSERLMQERGLELRPYWWHAVNIGSPQTARALLHLMMRDPDDRPDALIVADDNLLEAATLGMLDAGARPGEVEIVAHCNFPYPTPAHLPVHRLGFDVREVLARCINDVDAVRAGVPPAPLFHIPACWEAEITAEKNWCPDV